MKVVVIIAPYSLKYMGRGDKKTRKGKIWKGSFGVSRRRKAIQGKIKPLPAKPPIPVVVVTVEEKPKAKRVSKKKENPAV